METGSPAEATVAFGPEGKKKLDAIVSRYPNRMAACLPALHLAQAEFGHLSDPVVEAVASYLSLPVAHVHGVVTFYTMFHRHPVGKNVLMVCTNVSCMLRGAYDVLARCEQELGVKPGETTPDGDFTLVEEECLAACANAPMMICGTEYFLDVDAEKVPAIIAELRKNPRSEHV
jgi:NADH-quinone oxidoreductase E subunit